MNLKPWEELNEIRAALALSRRNVAELEAKENTLEHRCKCELYPYRIASLSCREAEVLRLMQREISVSNKQLGEQLHISQRTVKFHLTSLMRKYHVPSRYDLISVSMLDGEIVKP